MFLETGMGKRLAGLAVMAVVAIGVAARRLSGVLPPCPV